MILLRIQLVQAWQALENFQIKSGDKGSKLQCSD